MKPFIDQVSHMQVYSTLDNLPAYVSVVIVLQWKWKPQVIVLSFKDAIILRKNVT